MSEEQLIEVVSKALIDPKFRALLVDAPKKAVKGYDLTTEEKQLLKDIKMETLESFSTELEERVSRAGMNFLGANMAGEVSEQQIAALEQNIQNESRRFQIISQAFKAAHQAALNAIRNIRA